MVIKTESPGKIGSNDGQMQRATSGALGGCVRVIQTYEKVSLACRLRGGRATEESQNTAYSSNVQCLYFDSRSDGRGYPVGRIELEDVRGVEKRCQDKARGDFSTCSCFFLCDVRGPESYG